MCDKQHSRLNVRYILRTVPTMEQFYLAECMDIIRTCEYISSDVW